MEFFKRFGFYINDLTDEAKDRFIQFLGDNGNHDVIPLFVYETVCDEGNCEGCDWECNNLI